MKSINIYKGVAVLGALFLIANALYISHQDHLSQFSTIVDLVIAPITVIAASFWYHKKIVLLGVALYFLGCAGNIHAQFNLISLANPLQTLIDELYILEVIGLIVVIAAGFDSQKYSNSWLKQKVYNVEFNVLATVVISFLSMSGLILLLN